MFNRNKSHTHFLCWFLAWLMPFTFCLSIRAQEVQSDEKPERTTLLADPPIVPVPDVVDTPLDATYLLPQGCVVVSLRPQAILNSPVAKMMPIEVLQAGSIQQAGVDILQMDRLVASMEAPAMGPPNFAAMASFTAPIAGKLHPQLTAHTAVNSESDRPHFKSGQPLLPSLYFPSDTVVLVTPEITLQKFLAEGLNPADSSLHPRLLKAASDDIYVGVDFVPLRPLANMALMQTSLPTELSHFYMAPDLIKTIELRLNVSHPGISELIVESNNVDDAEKLEQLLLKTVDMIRAEVSKEAAALKANPDPVQQALGRYQERMIGEMQTTLMPKREGDKLVIFHVSGENGQASTLTMTAVSGILIALLLPAVQAAREAARRNASINNTKNLLLALLNYESAKGNFPAYANFSPDGKPLLSWRVHVLPYLDQKALYDQFHLDEPWDSEHNKMLIAKMPELFLDPSSGLNLAEGRTHYLGVKGIDKVFSGAEKGTTLREIKDGTSNTLLIVQVNNERATSWTKPDDWEVNEKNPLDGLAPNLHPGIFVAGFADGSVRNINTSLDLEVFKNILTIAGGEPVNNP